MEATTIEAAGADAGAREPDLATLSWCLGEIRASLASSEAGLRAELARVEAARGGERRAGDEACADDVAGLRAARAALHQAHGALALVDLPGVALLTAEAETLLDLVERGQLPLSRDLVERVSRGFSALLEYLDGLLLGEPQQPLYLFPCYRDLLQARGAERVHPADLYVVPVQARLVAAADTFRELAPEQLSAARTQFERGLLQVLRNPGDDTGIAALHAAVGIVESSQIGARHPTFWKVALAYFEALRDRAVALDVYGKRLLARMNLQLRRSIADGAPVAERLMKDTLFALARADGPGSELLAQVRRAFSLDSTVPPDFEEPRFGRVDARALAAAREAIARAKPAWEKLSHGSQADLAGFAQAIAALRAAAARLPGTGGRDLADAFAQTSGALASASGRIPEALALEGATALLFAEQELARGAAAQGGFDARAGEMAARLRQASAGCPAADEVPQWLREASHAAQERLTLSAFVAETQANLRSAEQALDSFFRDPAQRADLPQAGRQLLQVSGALRMLGHAEAAEAAARGAQRVEAFAAAEEAPPASGCELVASSLGALGFFVDGLHQSGRAGARFSFDAASGVFSAALPEPRREHAVVVPIDGGARRGDAAAPRTAEEQVAGRSRRAGELVESLREAPADAALRDELRDTLEQLRDDAQLVDDAALKSRASEAIALLEAGGDADDTALQAALAGIAGGSRVQSAPVPAVPAAPAAAAATSTEASADGGDNGGGTGQADDDLLAIFLGEAREVLAAIDAASAQSHGAPADQALLATIRRGFHTLKGSSRMVGLADFGDAAWAMEQTLNAWLADERAATPPLHRLVGLASQRIGHWVSQLERDASAGLDPAPVVEAAVALRESLPHEAAFARLEALDAPAADVRVGDQTISRALYDSFLAEADELVETLSGDVAGWIAAPARAATEDAQRAMHSLKGIAALVQLGDVQALAERLEAFLLHQRSSGQALPAEDLAEYARALERLRAMLHRFAAGSEAGDESEALVLAQGLATRWDPRNRPQAPEQAAHDERASDDELDEELLPIFIEEATDYLPQVGENLRRWLEAPADRSVQQVLMRHLHTIKGSARMAGAMELGQLVHEMEARIEAASVLSAVPCALIEELIGDYDCATAMFESVRDPVARAQRAQSRAAEAEVPGADGVRSAAEAAEDTIAEASSGTSEASGTSESSSAVELSSAGEPLDASGAPEPAAAAAPPSPAVVAPAIPGAVVAARAASSPAAAAAALVRVRADLLEKVVNESGEVAIARSRLDNELGQLRQSLHDLTENVGRLRSQLREIEIQAESQIQARAALKPQSHADFDPLEFDRYTRFQELARMLAESVSDVAAVQHHAMRNLDDASQEMTRQSQVLREMQQNLMRMRMVPFRSVGDRLYRVARQAAKQLGKRVVLDIRGAAVEVDRAMLERMAGPIEHVLRNAVAHGIEAPQVRAAAGKPETGEIRVEVRQEGHEVVLAVDDDGAGLDYERIAARARALGLIGPDDQPVERELADMIFVPGFSTATEVTELAGRGVGTDAVRAEVVALGGRIDVESRPGAGTRFTMHLPLTMAIAQVVLATVGDAHYAIPSSSVEQIAQLKPQALAAAYAEGSIEWQGVRVPMHYLGALVGSEARPIAQHLSPVVVVRSGNLRLALHVDAVSRNQEVVVKNVGAQVARVPGVSGATILGSGEIVLILNPARLAQAVLGDRWLDRPAPNAQRASLQDVPSAVMVVDDSLTVRKATQRLLAREGFDVMLAKDGVDALRQLQDRRPDLMLVDIEMPRMDGFDLVRSLRGDERFRDIPVVMITSRTADKHRNHALSLGVDAYLGKPYCEDELLGYVARFTSSPARRAGA